MIAGFNRVEFRLQIDGALRFFTRFVALGAAAGSLAVVSAYAMRPAPDLGVDLAAEYVPQITNAQAKSDRLAIMVRAALHSDLRPSFALAEIVQSAELERFYDAVTPALDAANAAPTPAAYALASAPADGPTLASVTSTPVELEAAPLPPRKPKRAPAEASNNILDDGQIAGIRTRLKLTSSQAEYWPAVETALRDVARLHFNRGAMRANRGSPSLDVNSPEVQKLIWAAMPLLRQLREDQKREVRQLVRVIGLHSVAAHI